MNRFTFLVLLSLIAFTGSAMAQDENTLGLYFDPFGDLDCVQAESIPPFTQFPLYMILKNPTFNELHGIEVGYDVEGPAILTTVLHNNPEALDVGTTGNHIVGYGTPTLMEQNTLIMTLQMFYTSTSNEEVCFVLHGTNPSSIDPAYPTALLPGGELMVLDLNHGVDAACTAIISEFPCEVATSEHSWDAVKSLYR